MDILVMLKPVPDPERYGEIRIDEDSKRLIREGIKQVISPSDRCALEEALKLRESEGGEVVVLSMAPEFSRPVILEALAMGADRAYLLSDPKFAGADTFATSKTLAEAVKRIGNFDLILAGNESADGATSHVPAQVGEWLCIDHVCRAVSIAVGKKANGEYAFTVRKRSESGDLVFECQAPAVIAVMTGINKPRYTSAMGIIKAGKKPFAVWGIDEIGLQADETGIAGSTTKSGDLMIPDTSRDTRDIEGDPAEIAAGIVDIMRRSGVM